VLDPWRWKHYDYLKPLSQLYSVMCKRLWPSKQNQLVSCIRILFK
jgi:hypothetical protein